MASRRALPVRKKKRATAKGGRKKVKVGKPKPAKKKVAGGRKKVRASSLRSRAPGSGLRTPKKKVSRKPATPPRKKKVSRKPATPPRKKKVVWPSPSRKTQDARRRLLAPGKWDRLLERLVGIFGLSGLAEVLDRKPSVVRGWKKRGVPENVRLSLRAVDEAVEETPPPPPLAPAYATREEATAAIRAAKTPEEIESVTRAAFGLPPKPPPPPPVDESKPENAAEFVAKRMVDFLMARQVEERKVTGDAWKMAKESFKEAFGIREWRRWYDWIVEEYDLDDYIFDYEALRDT